MGIRTSVAKEGPPPPGTVTRLFLEAVDRFGDETALRSFVGSSNELTDLSYNQVLEQSARIADALGRLGLERGDRAAILSENRTEWALADYGCLLAGVISVPIYDTLVSEQVGFILENSGARLVFASSADQVAKVREAVGRRGSTCRLSVSMGRSTTRRSMAGPTCWPLPRMSTWRRSGPRLTGFRPTICARFSTPRARPVRPRA